MYISAIHPMLRMMIDQRLTVLFPNQNPAEPFPVEEVRKAAKYALESYRSPIHESCTSILAHTQVSSSKLQHPLRNTLSTSSSSASAIRATTDDDARGKHIDMIDQLSKATAAGLPLAYYNPYRFPSYSPQPQAAAPQAVQQQTIVLTSRSPSWKTESSMEERLLAAIQKLVDKGGANKRCGYNGCEIGYKECVAKESRHGQRSHQVQPH